MFKQLFSEETLKRYAEFGDMMPNREVKPGESWTLKRTMSTGAGYISVDMKFTFKKWDQQNGRRCVDIEIAGDMAAAAGATTGSPVKIEKGKVEGDVWFDPELGMLVAEHANQDIALKVNAGGQNLAPQVNQRINLSLLDVINSQ